MARDQLAAAAAEVAALAEERRDSDERRSSSSPRRPQSSTVMMMEDSLPEIRRRSPAPKSFTQQLAQDGGVLLAAGWVAVRELVLGAFLWWVAVLTLALMFPSYAESDSLSSASGVALVVALAVRLLIQGVVVLRRQAT